MTRIVFAFLVVLVMFVAISCASEGADIVEDVDDAVLGGVYSDTGDDDTDDDDTTAGGDCSAVKWDYITVDAMPAPPNPLTGELPPPHTNKVSYYRYRADTGDAPPRVVDAVLILLPGYTVGANYLTYMARKMVEMSCGTMEAWIAERRPHQLEDTFGMQVAERENDPQIAVDYYFKKKAVEGRKFAGFRDPHNEETGFLSEWGLDIAMHDIRTVVHQVPPAKREATVFLAGHSRGAAYVKAFAAYEFHDGTIGGDELAGVVLIDGETRYNPLITENVYKAAIQGIRAGVLPRYMTLPPLGPPVYQMVEILAMTATEGVGEPGDPRLGPDGQFGYLGPMTLFKPLFFRFRDIKITNEALMAYATDKESGLVNLLLAGVGKLNGPTKKDFLGVYPSDETVLYTWKKFDEVQPPEYSDIQDMARAFWEGPSNSTDPYYATRFDFDFWAANDLENAGTWREKYFTFRISDMDAPVYVLGSRLLSTKKKRVEYYRSQLPPVRGQSRPRSEYGFDTLWIPEWEHIDTVFAIAETNEFFIDLIQWIDEFSQGEVMVR
jgi:hypothetical protein